MARAVVTIAVLAVSSANSPAADRQHLGIDRSEFQARFTTAQNRLHHKIIVGPLECGAASIVRSCRGRIGEAIAFNRIETFDKVGDAAKFAAGAPGKLQSVSATLDSYSAVDAHRSLFEDVCAAIAIAFDTSLSSKAAQSHLGELYRRATAVQTNDRAVASAPLGQRFLAAEVWDKGRGSISCGVYPTAPR